MNWKTLAVLPIIAVMAYIILAAVSFGERVGSTWSDATTATVTNGMVMVCFGASFFGVFLISIVVGVALASRLLAQPVRLQGERPSFADRLNARSTPPGWDAGGKVVDSYGEQGRVVSIEPPPGLRPMLPGQTAIGGIVPVGAGVFDAMEDEVDRRYRSGGD